MHLEPKVIEPALHAAVPTAQGQRSVVMLDGINVPPGQPRLPFSMVAIPMEPGKVTIPHIHDEIHVCVVLAQCDPGGVLTLHGDYFQHATWLYAGQALHIPPGLKHMAIRPRSKRLAVYGEDSQTGKLYAADALAYETRGTPDPLHDVRQLPEDWMNVVIKLDSMNLMDSITWPVEAFSALAAMGVTP